MIKWASVDLLGRWVLQAASSRAPGSQNQLLPCPALGLNSLFRVMIPAKHLVSKLVCIQRALIFPSPPSWRRKLLLSKHRLCFPCSQVRRARSASASVRPRGANPWLMRDGIFGRGERGCTHTLLPLTGLAQLPTPQAPLKSCPALIHFSSMRRRAEKTQNPEKGKTTLNFTFPPRINHGWPGSEATGFNLHVSQGRSKPIPPEVKGWFN